MQTHSTDYKSLYSDYKSIYPHHSRLRTSQYRFLPTLLTGIVILAITLFTSTLTYTMLCYFNNVDGNCSAKASLFIYMFSLFVACFIMSFIIRGKSLKPALILGALYYVFGMVIFVLANGWAQISVGGIFEKLLFTLFSVLFAYMSAFLICFARSTQKAKRFRKYSSNLKKKRLKKLLIKNYRQVS